MRVIKIRRHIGRGKNRKQSVLRIGQNFFAKENHLEFAIEALLFAVLVAASVWPIAAVAGALNQLS